MTSGPPSDYPQGQGTLAAAASGPLRAHHGTPYAASCPPARTNHAAASGQAHLDKTSRMRGGARWWPKLTTACLPDWPSAGSRLPRMVAAGQSAVRQSASVCHSGCGKMRPLAYGAIQFLDPWAGRVCRAAGAGARCPRRSPNLKELSTIDRARRSPPPHRCPTLPSAAAPFDRPSTAGTAEVRPLCWVTVSCVQRPSCSSSSERPCVNPYGSHPVGGQSPIPRRLTQRRQAAAVHALPGP